MSNNYVLSTTYGGFAAGTQPLSDIDGTNNQLAAMGTLMCSSSGTNTITLSSLAGYPTMSAYGANQKVGFVATTTSSTSVTIRYSALSFLNAYLNDGVTPVGSGGITTGFYYEFSYIPALNSGSGGWQQITPVLPTSVMGSAAAGTLINAKMSVASPNATATFTADQIVTATTLGGNYQTLSNYSQAINLSTTGAGGMDTGTAPISGFVSLYAIFGSSETSILACNVTTSTGTIYAGANMPSGYTYSSLIGIWQTNASSQFPIGYQTGRRFFFVPINILDTASPATSYTSISLSGAVPPGATTVSGEAGSNTSAVSGNISLAGDVNGTGEQLCLIPGSTVPIGTYFSSAPFNDLPVITTQTIYYKGASSGTNAARINVTSYSF